MLDGILYLNGSYQNKMLKIANLRSNVSLENVEVRVIVNKICIVDYF